MTRTIALFNQAAQEGRLEAETIGCHYAIAGMVRQKDLLKRLIEEAVMFFSTFGVLCDKKKFGAVETELATLDELRRMIEKPMPEQMRMNSWTDFENWVLGMKGEIRQQI